MKIEDMPTGPDLSEYDWHAVFERISLDPKNIEEFIHAHAESPEGYGSINLEALCRLTNGNYAVIDAWADTTGWGCQDGAHFSIHTSLKRAYMLGLSDRGREWFGISEKNLPG